MHIDNVKIFVYLYKYNDQELINRSIFGIFSVVTRGTIVLLLCSELAVLYTFNCLLVLIYYRLGQNILKINKYVACSRYS